jgi:hypothetical protein
MLKYHTKSLTLLGITPKVSQASVRILDQIEKHIGFKLPLSVREWYSLEAACDILLKYSNADPPIPIEKLGEPCHDTHGGGPHDLLSQGLLPIRYENQGVCVWAIKLDGSDDPPVVVDFDTQFKTWLHYADNFSTHIYCWLLDYAVVFNKDFTVMANIEPLQEQALAFLQREFEEGPRTFGWPGDVQYRFFRKDQSILLWASKQQCDWFITAATLDSLMELVHSIWQCSTLADNLYSNHTECEKMLSQFRKK